MLPTALAIAGLDPSGGAGLAADLRSFGAAGVWGAAVCAALTVQSTRGVRAVRAVPAPLVLAQAREVLADARVRALKTGALGSAANARAVLRLIAEHPGIPVVVDPVMIPSRRRAPQATLHGRGVGPLRALAEAAALVTPNLVEAAALLGRAVDEDAAPEAAAALVAAGAQAALVKGGHGRGAESVDWLALRGGRLVRIARPAAADPALSRRRVHARLAHRRAPRRAPRARRAEGGGFWSKRRAGRGRASTGPSRRRSPWARVSAFWMYACTVRWSLGRGDT